MSEQSITCPKCGTEIPLTKALKGQIEQQLRASHEAELEQQAKELRAEYDQQLEEERKKSAAIAKKATEVELKALQEQLAERDQALDQAKKQELALLKKERELTTRQQDLELETERRLHEQRTAIEQEVSQRIEEAHRLKDLEKDKQMTDLRRQIEDWQRKAQQGSQQIQGEAAEEQLEGVLQRAFPTDKVAPVEKGIRGADLVQDVCDGAGRTCGRIVWEIKNTKQWSDGWVDKLKADQRKLKADIAVLASVVLPRDVQRFAQYDGVWVAEFAVVVSLATVLRVQLTEVYTAKQALAGQEEKSQQIYSYLVGTEFRQRVESVVEAFEAMKDDLDRERRSMEAMWAKREKQLQRALQGMAGMYGDIHGIVGASMPAIEPLEMPTGLLGAGQ